MSGPEAQSRRRMRAFGAGPEEGCEGDQSAFSYEESLRELSLFSLWGDHIAALKGVCKQERL